VSKRPKREDQVRVLSLRKENQLLKKRKKKIKMLRKRDLKLHHLKI